MTIQDKIAADQEAVTNAQDQLNAAIAALAADQKILESIAPHLTLLDQIEAEFVKLESDLQGEILQGVDKLKTAITPYIDQMRALFSA